MLHLSSNALRGQLPRELLNLTTLQSFDVSSNLISGGLEHVLTISTLLSLDASANLLLLTGSVSFIREAGRGLVKLAVSGNHFDGLVFAADFVMRGRGQRRNGTSGSRRRIYSRQTCFFAAGKPRRCGTVKSGQTNQSERGISTCPRDAPKPRQSDLGHGVPRGTAFSGRVQSQRELDDSWG